MDKEEYLRVQAEHRTAMLEKLNRTLSHIIQKASGNLESAKAKKYKVPFYEAGELTAIVTVKVRKEGIQLGYEGYTPFSQGPDQGILSIINELNNKYTSSTSRILANKELGTVFKRHHQPLPSVTQNSIFSPSQEKPEQQPQPKGPDQATSPSSEPTERPKNRPGKT